MSGDYVERLRAAVDDDADVLSVTWELFPKLRTDLRAALDELEQLRAKRADLGEMHEERAVRSDQHEAFCATRDGALRIAKDWNRIRPGGPWRAEYRAVGQWREVPDA